MTGMTVGSLRKDPGYGRVFVDVQRYDDRGSAYPVIECEVWLAQDDRLRPGVAQCCTSTYPPTVRDWSNMFDRVRSFIDRNDGAIRTLLN